MLKFTVVCVLFKLFIVSILEVRAQCPNTAASTVSISDCDTLASPCDEAACGGNNATAAIFCISVGGYACVSVPISPSLRVYIQDYGGGTCENQGASTQFLCSCKDPVPTGPAYPATANSLRQTGYCIPNNIAKFQASPLQGLLFRRASSTLSVAANKRDFQKR